MPSNKAKLTLSEWLKIAATTITSVGVIVGVVWYIAKPHVEKLILETLPVSLSDMSKNAADLDKRVTRIEDNVDGLRESITKQDMNMQIIIYMLRKGDTTKKLDFNELNRKPSNQFNNNANDGSE